MAMMGHMIDVEKSNAKYKEPTVSSNSEKCMSSTLEMIEYVFNTEKPDETYQIMRNMFGVCKIMRDAFIEPDDEN